MRIAQVAPLYESVPPQHYGGTERVVSYLTEELVALGHEVTLSASSDSQTTARLVAACPRAQWHDPNVRAPLPHHVRLVEMVLRDARKFDVIHFHCDYVHFPFVRWKQLPTKAPIMAIALTPKRRAVVCAFMAIVQLAGAVTAGVSFAQGGNALLASASAAFTCALMLVNRWYFRGWREFHRSRQRKSLPRTRMF